MISKLKSRYKLSHLCSSARVSKSGYYKFIKNNNPYKDYDLIMDICSIQKYHHYSYGYRKITAALNSQNNTQYNKKRVYRLMKENDLLCVVKKKKNIHNKPYYRTNNKLKRNFQSEIRYEKLVTDITEINYKNKKLYLSAVIDCYNSEVVSYEISDRNNLKLVNDTFKSLILDNKYYEGTTIHSDQGFQYTHKYHNKQMKKHGIIQSMSRKGTPLDNAVIESFFGTMKSELIYNPTRSFENSEELIEELHKWIVYYNTERIQLKLGYEVPVKYKKVV